MPLLIQGGVTLIAATTATSTAVPIGGVGTTGKFNVRIVNRGPNDVYAGVGKSAASGNAQIPVAETRTLGRSTPILAGSDVMFSCNLDGSQSYISFICGQTAETANVLVQEAGGGL